MFEGTVFSRVGCESNLDMIILLHFSDLVKLTSAEIQVVFLKIVINAVLKIEI